jgi:Mrp family chromosome partitioning ATPase
VLAKSTVLAAILAELAVTYDHVVVDLPAVLTASESLAVASVCDAVALVVRQGVTSETQVTEAIEALGDKSVIGVVLNAITSKTPRAILRRIPIW